MMNVAVDESTTAERVPTVAGEITVAPYAVVRLAAATPRTDAPAAADYRDVADRLVELHTWCATHGPAAGDELFAAIGRLATMGAAAPELRPGLVALRRDVHNQRTPRTAARAAVSAELPLTTGWLAARDALDALAVELASRHDAALRADRRGLADLSSGEALQRAVGLTSDDLLRAVRRAAAMGDNPDSRARKSEATVLRYVARALTKTTPLSWFTEVAWGTWSDADADADAEIPPPAPIAVARADRAALGALIEAVLARRDLRHARPHRLAPGSRLEAARLLYRRPAADAPPGIVREEQIAVPLTGPLRLVLAATAAGATVRPADLVTALAARLATPGAATAATAYVDGLLDAGILRPSYPIDPQAIDALDATARWLTDAGRPDVAAILADIDTGTGAFADVAGVDRPAALAGLRTRWAAAFDAVGAPSGGRAVPLTEDVVRADTLPLGDRYGRAALADLARLGPLFEVYDQYAVVRRAARDRFVARYGPGGRCTALEEFTGEYADVWRTLDRLHVDGGIRGDGPPLGAALEELADLRTRLAAAHAADTGTGPDGERILSDTVVADAAAHLPTWLRDRPTSYALFGSPLDGGRVCLNQVYGGWGRFTSRFLSYLDPAAQAAVRTQITRTLDGSRIAQIRPVNGFNANLHPRIVDDEIGDARRWATITADDLHMVHDVATDGLRVCHAATGEPIDVLYHGFLVEAALPDRLMPLLTDLASGLVGYLGALAPPILRDTPVGPVRHRRRMRYRDVVLARAQWQISAEAARAWRADLDAEAGPGPAVARWRAALGLPEHVFVGAAPTETDTGLAALASYFDRAKSQHTDLGSALAARNLSRTLARYPDGLLIEEALPAPHAGRRAVEVVAEIYRRYP